MTGIAGETAVGAQQGFDSSLLRDYDIRSIAGQTFTPADARALDRT